MNRVNSLIPRAHSRMIYEYLMKEGVIVCFEDKKAPKHIELGIPNLHVLKAMRTLKSKNYVTETYNWRYYYYVLNNEGIEFLREELQVPATVFPDTCAQRARPGPRPERRGGFRRERGDDEGAWTREPRARAIPTQE